MAEKVAIDGIELPRDGYVDVLNLFVLWQGPDVKGRDRPLPLADGSLPFRRRAAASVRTLQLVVYGFKSYAGVAHANVREGIETNIDHLRSNVADIVETGDGTRTVVLTLPSGATKTGAAHVGPLVIGEGVGPAGVRATLDVSIPGGALA